MPLQKVANTDIQTATTFVFSNTLFGLGSAGAPSLAFSGDTNTGIFSPGADTIAFAEGGVESMRIDSSGRVGIGTSSPTAQLTVANTVSISGQTTLGTGSPFSTNLLTLRSDAGASAIPGVTLDMYGSTLGSVSFRKAGGTIASPSATTATSILSLLTATTGDGINYNNTAAIQSILEATATTTSMPTAFTFATTPAGSVSRSERMRITSDGNVGIGISSPSFPLDVYRNATGTYGSMRLWSGSSAQFAPRLVLKNDIAGAVREYQIVNGGYAGSFSIEDATASANRFLIDSSGNVGIGTASPAVKLNVGRAGIIGVLTGVNAVFNADSNDQYGGIQINSYDDNTKRFGIINNNGVTSIFGYGSNSIINLGTDNAQPVLISTNNTERMRINESGGVGIGTSTIPAFTKLQVTGTAGLQTGANQQIQVSAPTTTAGHGAGIRLSAASGAKEAVAIIGVVNEASGNSGALVFHNYAGGATVPEYMRIDSAGRVTKPYQPAFHAVSTSIKEITGSPFVFDTAYFNTGGHYNTSNGRFTAPIAGIYYLQMDFLTSNSNSNTVDLRFYKNGTQTQLGTAYYTNYTGGDHRKGFMIALASLNANDYITVQTQSGGTNGNLYGDTNESGGKGHTAFRAFLMG